VKKLTRLKARFNDVKIESSILIAICFPRYSLLFQQSFPPGEKPKKLFKNKFSPLFHQIHRTNNNKNTYINIKYKTFNSKRDSV